jgi:hypothetical protein
MDLIEQIARLPKAHSPDGAVCSLYFFRIQPLAKEVRRLQSLAQSLQQYSISHLH